MTLVLISFADDVPEDLRKFCMQEMVLRDVTNRGACMVYIGTNQGPWQALRSKHTSEAGYPYMLYDEEGHHLPLIQTMEVHASGQLSDGTRYTRRIEDFDRQIPEWFANVGEGWQIFSDEALI